MNQGAPLPSALVTSRDEIETSRCAMRSAATAFVSKGYAIFAAGVGSKAPHHGLSGRGFLDARRDVTPWNVEPLANIGFPTGRLNGLTVLDLDVKNGHDGVSEYARLCDHYGVDPFPGVVTQTPSGGLHVWYRTGQEPVPSLVGWADGIDVRGDGGYVLAPPSIVRVWVRPGNGDPKNGGAHAALAPYQWSNGTGAPEIPSALLDGLRNDRWATTSITTHGAPSESIAATGDVLRDGLRPGSRNSDLHRLACRWWRLHWDQPSLVAALAYEVWSVTPHDDFSWDEAWRCVESARQFIEQARAAESWQSRWADQW